MNKTLIIELERDDVLVGEWILRSTLHSFKTSKESGGKCRWGSGNAEPDYGF